MNLLFDNIGGLYTLSGAVEKGGRNIGAADLGVIHEAAMAVSKGKILWTGKRREIPSPFKKFKRVNSEGKIVLPGFVDSHTHLVFAGDRAGEFEMRLAGKTYNEIAQAGGGIKATMKATRETKKKDLLGLSHERLNQFVRQGVTTVEIKTGYGLSFESEKKCLEIIADLKKSSKATVRSTFLATHALPPEFQGRSPEYVKVTSNEWLPKLAKLVDFVDMFIDDGYFTVADAAVLLASARDLGLPSKFHADELKLTGGTEFSVNHGSLSCDHLLKIGEKEIRLLAQSETTATLLPTTAFFLKTDYAPARKLLDAGARVALASDFNPGTSPTQDISIVGALSALHMGMRMDEIVVALTFNGAYALGLQSRKGALLPEFDADFMMIPSDSPAHLFYNLGARTRLPEVFVSGRQFKVSQRS